MPYENIAKIKQEVPLAEPLSDWFSTPGRPAVVWRRGALGRTENFCEIKWRPETLGGSIMD